MRGSPTVFSSKMSDGSSGRRDCAATVQSPDAAYIDVQRIANPISDRLVITISSRREQLRIRNSELRIRDPPRRCLTASHEFLILNSEFLIARRAPSALGLVAGIGRRRLTTAR